MKYTILIFAGLFCLTRLSAMDDDVDISFKHIEVNDGLSNSQINYITKDSQGFMWFSTQFGLNRYDGYLFRVFTRNSKNPWSLPDNSVEDVHENGDGLLFVHTSRDGYVCYDPDKEIFYPADTLLKERYGIPNPPSLMYLDGDKNIWSYAYGGTHYYNIEKQQLFFYPVAEKFMEQGIGLTSFAEDDDGVILIYSNGSFEKVDKTMNEISHRTYLPVTTSSFAGYKMFIDADGDYWIYGNSGAWVYYTAQARWEYLSDRKDSPYMLSGNLIKDIKMDSQKNVWIALDHGGINIIDKGRHSIKHLRNDTFDERSLKQNSINCLYCDDNGSMWVGYYKRGISYYNESVFKFRTDNLSEFIGIENFTSDVNTIVEDKNTDLWIGTSNGLIFIDRKNGERKIYRHKPGVNSLSGDVIISLLKARDGRTWIGTFRDGLNVFDGRAFVHYGNDPKNPGSLASDDVYALAESSDGHIWIGTLGNGLQRFDPLTGEFTRYPKPSTGFDGDYILISSICVSRDTNIYMATNDGIMVYSPSTDTFEKWLTNKRGTEKFSHNILNEIYEDSRGLLWVATAEGLNVYDRRHDRIIIPVSDSALGSEVTQAIVEDNNKNMWITTTTGISCIVVNTDPRTGTYTYTSHRYGKYDGLYDQQFNPRAMIKTLHGGIIAGGVNGLSFFDPESLKYNHTTPKIEFTKLELSGVEVKIDSVYSGNRILTRSLNRTETIELKHKQFFFSVSFSAMNYILPEKTKYSYILEGFDSEWHTTDANKLTYTDLAPGKYTLKVKAVNSDGFSNNEASELEIMINPPFRSSPMAYFLYSLMVVGILLLIRKEILRNERNKFRLMQIEQDARQRHEIDDMKLQFFTNVGHELRTPLTLIISPLESAIKQTDDESQKSKLEMVQRNAIRLLGLVNQLLDFRKSDVQEHRLNVQHGDVVVFIQNICNSFSEYSEKKDVHLTFFSAVNELWMAFDEDKLGKVMMNLLSNAFKFTPAGGRVDVALNMLPGLDDLPEQFEIRISDTGIGINDEDKKHIFERFYQVQHSWVNKSSGSGIGLHLVREFVDLHGGSVSVLDNADKGSVFIVTLPVVRVDPEPKQETDLTEKCKEIVALDPRVDIIEEETESPEGDKRPVVLIVDDNEDFRLFMRNSLKTDYRVQTAVDGVKAWDMIPTLQPDIIVSDVMMPEMDGNELCRLVKSDIRTSHIPLVLLTARSDKEQKMEGLESGADEYITKPFDFDILSLRIKKMLQLRQTRQAGFPPHMEINPSKITITSLDEKLINKAVKYVEDNMGRVTLSVEELSAELGINRVHLYKKMLSITGKTPIEFIRIIRLKRAAQYLRESQQSVSEIAYQTGFNNPKYFRKYFKDEFGMLPSEYQDKESVVENASRTFSKFGDTD